MQEQVSPSPLIAPWPLALDEPFPLFHAEKLERAHNKRDVAYRDAATRSEVARAVALKRGILPMYGEDALPLDDYLR